MIDLHVHSTFSDGSLTPSELVVLANKIPLKAMALTDHDTVDGIDEFLNAAKDTDLFVIPGIELSSALNGKDVHIVGLFVNHKDKALGEKLITFRNARNTRNAKMITLMREHGFDITQDIVDKRFPDSVITRAHYAVWMVEKGYVKDKNEAFDKYLNPGCPCYLPKKNITPMEAIDTIHDAGGIAIIAHPLLYKLTDSELDNLVRSLKEYGLDGLEAVYSANKWTDESRMRALAKKYDLILSGGSDFHGAAKPTLSLGTGYGDLNVPDEICDELKKYKKRAL